ncbi:MAG: uracil-DNA glycosylase [Paludibacteraceae bacterium]|nr:uracil-DNA glycosylase [Paludibacteraceae bacterium]
MDVKIEPSWKEILSAEFEEKYFVELVNFVKHEYGINQVYPKAKNLFNAFNLCPFDSTKVVIIGQDPYHGEGQAHGLCFSVPDHTPIPPSLQNIFKEIKNDLEITPFNTGNLERWAKQGVLLLNATLTVRANVAGSHQGKGWEIFTDKVIQLLSKKKKNLVFILWGSYAQQKKELIDTHKHCIFTSTHPSPLSAYRGFFGNKHFSQTNTYLIDHGKEPIDWR